MTLQPNESGDTLDPALADYLLGMLAGSLPPAENEQVSLARREAVRLAFRALRPRNPMEAMLAAEAIAAHHVIMDCFRIALSPETEPAAAARARSNAATLSRIRLATLRALEKQKAPASATTRPAAPARQKAHVAKQLEAPQAAEPAQQEPPPTERELPPMELPTEPPPYLPRDRFGHPIERWRWEDMTMAQRRAAYAEPGRVAVREEALAEEAAAIAAQAAEDAIAPDPGTGAPVMPRQEAPC
jgi:hypothetical protein